MTRMQIVPKRRDNITLMARKLERLVEDRPSEFLNAARQILNVSEPLTDSKDYGAVDRSMLSAVVRLDNVVMDHSKYMLGLLKQILHEVGSTMHPGFLVEMELSLAQIRGAFLVLTHHLELLARFGRNIDPDIHYDRIESMVEEHMSAMRRSQQPTGLDYGKHSRQAHRQDVQEGSSHKGRGSDSQVAQTRKSKARKQAPSRLRQGKHRRV